MAELEKKIQKRFFENLINQEKKFQNSPIAVYQKLIFQRYEEVLTNSFPLFLKEVDKKEFETSIKLFIKKNTPTSAFLWKVPKDYIKFVKKNKLFEKYLFELLVFDWLEIELYMKEYKEFESKDTFSYKRIYKLSKSAKIKRFKYDILNHNLTKKDENFVVVYYDFNTNEVVYRQINQLLYLILKSLKNKSVAKILKKLCKTYEISYKEAKEVLLEPLEELFKNKVFI